MAEILNYSATKRVWFPRKVRLVAFVFLGICLTTAGMFVVDTIQGVLAWRDGVPEISRAMSAVEISDTIDRILRHMDVEGSGDHYSSVTGKFATPLNNARGFIRYGGFDGGGSEWIEVQIDPGFATNFRDQLAKASGLRRSSQLPLESPSQSWWPRQWPSDAQCYRQGTRFEYLILPDTGTHAWFVRSFLCGTDRYAK